MNNISLPLPNNELKARIEKVREIIRRQNADSCIITSSVNQLYLNDFIWDGYLFIPENGEAVLFVKRPVNMHGERIVSIRKPEQILDFLPDYGISAPKKTLLESDTLSYASALRLQAALGNPEIGNISSLIRNLRSIKSDYELALLKESARIQSEVYKQIPTILKAGMTDIAFQIEMEYLLRKLGSIGIFRSYGENMDIFMGSILAGDNAGAASPYDFALGGQGISPALPLGANGTVLKSGTTIMVDMCGNFTPYQSDMTRSFAIGEVPEIAYKAHQLSLNIHEKIQNSTKGGTSCADLYNWAQEMVEGAGFEKNFMGTIQQAKFIGHGVGLEINEPPVLTPKSKEVLLPGMAIAIEPKFVLPSIGAVGMENTYIVTESGLEKITLCEEKLIPIY